MRKFLAKCVFFAMKLPLNGVCRFSTVVNRFLKKFPIKKPWNGCFRAMRKAALGDLYVKFSFRVPLDYGIE